MILSSSAYSLRMEKKAPIRKELTKEQREDAERLRSIALAVKEKQGLTQMDIAAACPSIHNHETQEPEYTNSRNLCNRLKVL